jgi:sugar phosphate isomerase/epimerase
MATRRDFLATLGGAALGAVALDRARALGPSSPAGAPRAVGLQLYTVRSLLAKDFEGTIAKVAQIGYREVEFAGYFNRTPAQVRDVLAENHLRSPSTHVALPASEDAWSRTLDTAKSIGHQWVVIAWLDAALRTHPDDWVKIADRFNKLGEIAQSRGLRLAYHNHDFEFTRLGHGTGLDMLLQQSDVKVVDFEMDIYWVVKGGGDPLDLIARYPHRFPLMHAKDATPPPARAMADVGSGTIDFPKIFAMAAQSGMQHVYVEHDNPPDPLESARNSYRYLAALR